MRKHDPLCPHGERVQRILDPADCTYCFLIKQARASERQSLMHARENAADNRP